MLRLLLCLAAIAVLVSACPSLPPATPTPPHATPTATVAVLVRPTSTATPTATPTPAANIVVAAPTADAVVTSPLVVSGRARLFEAGPVVVRLKDGSGKTLAEGRSFTSAGAPEWGAYAITLPFTVPPTAQAGRLEVFTYSPRDGREEQLIVVPLRLAQR